MIAALVPDADIEGFHHLLSGRTRETACQTLFEAELALAIGRLEAVAVGRGFRVGRALADDDGPVREFARREMVLRALAAVGPGDHRSVGQGTGRHAGVKDILLVADRIDGCRHGHDADDEHERCHDGERRLVDLERPDPVGHALEELVH